MTQPASYDNILVCMPTTHPHVEGATVGHCARCAVPVWIAPSSRRAMEHMQLTVLCIQCLPDLSDIDQVDVIPGAIAEAAHHRRALRN